MRNSSFDLVVYIYEVHNQQEDNDQKTRKQRVISRPFVALIHETAILVVEINSTIVVFGANRNTSLTPLLQSTFVDQGRAVFVPMQQSTLVPIFTAGPYEGRLVAVAM